MEQCAKCGSARIVPEVQVLDFSGRFGCDDLTVAVDGRPEGLFFRDRLYGSLTAFICGDCGYAELRVDNPRALYKRYCEGRADS